MKLVGEKEKYAVIIANMMKNNDKMITSNMSNLRAFRQKTT